MDERTKQKIIKLLNLTASPNDHEAISSIKKANLLLKKENKTWDDFFSNNENTYEKPKYKQKGFSPMEREIVEEKIRQMLNKEISRSMASLLESFQSFLDRTGFLTSKQKQVLDKIWEEYFYV